MLPRWGCTLMAMIQMIQIELSIPPFAAWLVI
jgi:hypothetical protein